MSKPEMDRLAADYVANPSLQSLFEATDNLEQAVNVARGAGYEVEEGEVRDYLAAIENDSQTELSDAQLDAVAGGKKKKSYVALLDVQGNGGSLFGTGNNGNKG